MTERFEAAMRSALEEAEKALSEGEIPVGAALFRDGERIASAHNERESLCDPTAHAEMTAIRKAAEALGRRRLHDCTLVVTLEPCAMCAGAALAAGVKRIVFGACDPEKGCAGSLYALPEDPALGSIPCIGGVMETECRKLLDDFFCEKRKVTTDA